MKRSIAGDRRGDRPTSDLPCLEVARICRDQAIAVVAVDYSVPNGFAFSDRVQRGKGFHLLDHSLADLAMILNNEELCRAQEKALDLISILAELPGGQRAGGSRALKRKGYSAPVALVPDF